MKSKYIIGFAITFMIAMVSMGSVFSSEAQTEDIHCPNNGQCLTLRLGDGICDQSNCTGDCTERVPLQKQLRNFFNRKLSQNR